MESKIFLNNLANNESDAEFERSACQWLIDNDVRYVFLSCNKILKYDLLDYYGENNGRMFNCHPSLLPRLKGMNAVYRSFIDQNENYGASIHRMTREVDGGQILAHCIITKRDQDFEKYKHRLFVNQAILFLDFIYKICLSGCEYGWSNIEVNNLDKDEGFYPKLSLDVKRVKFLNHGDENYGLWNFIK